MCPATLQVRPRPIIVLDPARVHRSSKRRHNKLSIMATVVTLAVFLLRHKKGRKNDSGPITGPGEEDSMSLVLQREVKLPLIYIAYMKQANVPSLCANNASQRSVILLVNVETHIIGETRQRNAKTNSNMLDLRASQSILDTKSVAFSHYMSIRCSQRS